ncbi:MAG TPA: PDZ domain-containing protein [Longimicrobiaceae bacterium]|nr:PDZ domain-containing protein [Longimicrobiaceae bacterium]
MKATILLFALVFPGAAAAQAPVAYEVSFPNAVHHEAEVSVTFPDLPRRPLEVRMSRTSPGRYAMHEFAKNVYNVRAFDGRGRPLEVARPNPHQWNVAGHDGTVRITYTLFGNWADGTYTQISDSHAHLNIPATFLWARGLDRRPVRVTFRRPDPAWKIATQLVSTPDAETFTAPDLQYFMDSPVEISPHEVRTWETTSNGRSYTFRLAVHHRGTPEDVDRFAGMLKSLLAEEIGVYGELPEYDFGSYTFIADYLPGVEDDAMEHRNSTYLTGPRPLAEDALFYASLGAHELFHSWNAERIRPRSLEPFDFEEANLSGDLWFVEGFTSYYDDLLPLRAGLMQLDQFAESISGDLSIVLTLPGGKIHSPVEMSMLATFNDPPVSIDPTNAANTYISHYEGGTVIALGLDMLLRARFRNVTLDDYMRAMWRDFGRFEDRRTRSPQKPYTIDDLRQTLARVTGDRAFAEDFFRRYVEGREMIDFEAALAPAGLLLRRAAAGRPSLGVQLRYEEERAVISAPTLVGRPAYEAGLVQGDRIVTINGREIRSAADVSAVMSELKPGDQVAVAFERYGVPKQARVTLAENPRMEVVTYERAGRPVTDEIRAFRERWMASRARR